METSEYMPAGSGQRRKAGIRRGGIGVGTTSLLVIFTMLCMTTLALLSLSSAISNRRIQQRGVDGTVNLAAAYGEADRVLAEIDACLLEAGESAGDEAAYYRSALAMLEALGCEATGTDTAAFALPVDEDKMLVCEVRLSPPGEQTRYVEIARVVKLTMEWTPGGTAVWPGNI